MPNLPGAPPWPELAADLTRTGTADDVDECAQMRLYRARVLDFWREHPGEKARLVGTGGADALGSAVDADRGARARPGGFVDDARTWALPLYMIPLYVLGVIGLVVVPRRFAVLAVALLGYETLAAMVFAGATRYRVPWDFLLALAAGAALSWLLERWRRPAQRESRPRPPDRRHRRLGAAPADAAARARRAGRRRALRRARRPARDADPFYAELERARSSGSSRPCASSAAAVCRRSRGPDLVHTHLVHADVYGAVATGARRSSRRSTTTTRFAPGRGASPSACWPGGRARIVAITDAARALQRRAGRAARGQDRGRPLRARRAAPSRGPRTPSCRSPDDSPLLLCVARLAPQKGVDVAIRALPSIPDATLARARRGPGESELEALARELGVAGRVLMPGRVGDVAALYRRATSSSTRRAGRASGSRCSRRCWPGGRSWPPCSSTPEIVADGVTGLLVPPDDAEALARDVTTALGDWMYGNARARPRAVAVLGRADGAPYARALRERLLVELLGALDAALLEKVRQRPAAAGLAHPRRALEVARELDDRPRERRRLAGRDEHARLAVGRTSSPSPPIAAAITGRARSIASSATMPKPSPMRRDDDDRERSIASWIGVTWPRKRTASSIASSRASALSAGSSGPRPAMSSSSAGHLAPRLGERAQQHDVALDRDQPPDAEEARRRPGVRRRLAAGAMP